MYGRVEKGAEKSRPSTVASASLRWQLYEISARKRKLSSLCTGSVLEFRVLYLDRFCCLSPFWESICDHFVTLLFFSFATSFSTSALWPRITKNTDCPFACLLAPPCSLRLCAPLCSLVWSLAHFAHSQAPRTVKDWMAICSVFFSILAHGVMKTPSEAG